MITGRETVAVYCDALVPPEWIAAHGLRPLRLVPQAAAADGPVPDREGVCPFMRAFINQAVLRPGTGCIIAVATCDQMRRGAELPATSGHVPVFVMNAPATREIANALRLYTSELKRLGRFLSALSGTVPDQPRIAAAIRQGEEARAAVRLARNRITGRAFCEMLWRFHETGMVPDAGDDDSLRTSYGRAIPVGLVGGPLMRGDVTLLDRIESCGGAIVLDGTEYGELSLAPPGDRRAASEDPLAALADRFAAGISDIRRRPNSLFFSRLREETGRRAVQGIVLCRRTWCDHWAAEVYRIREWAGVPLLDLELANAPVAGTFTRIEAFMESLR